MLVVDECHAKTNLTESPDYFEVLTEILTELTEYFIKRCVFADLIVCGDYIFP